MLGGARGSLGMKIPQGPDASGINWDAPTAPMSESNLAQMFKGPMGMLQQAAAARDEKRFDESGMVGPDGHIAGFPRPLPPGINVADRRIQPQMSGVPMPQPRPQMQPPGQPMNINSAAQQSMAQAPQAPRGPFGLPSYDPIQNFGHMIGVPQPATGPELIKKFMAHLNQAGPAVGNDRAATNGY
jgi:hypothetical protein